MNRIAPGSVMHCLMGGCFMALAIMAGLAGCDRRGQSDSSSRPMPADVQVSPRAAGQTLSLPQADQRLCTGVVILIDTSGSMANEVPGATGAAQPKHEIARAALDRIVRYTGQWRQSNSDRVLNLAIYNFSSSASEVLPMGEFDLARAEQAVQRIPRPAGGTAIGEAIYQGFQALYASGCVRKYIVCITDGENTSGRRPDRVARQLHEQTQGDVEMHFVAFDTSAEHFGFLARVNGHVVEAADGEQLQARLSEIYEKRILAEAMPAEKAE